MQPIRNEYTETVILCNEWIGYDEKRSKLYLWSMNGILRNVPQKQNYFSQFFLSETFCYLLIFKLVFIFIFIFFICKVPEDIYFLYKQSTHILKCELFIFWFCQGCNFDVLTN